jgi:aminocarboxymuconate-semialdehyde decarboxylase
MIDFHSHVIPETIIAAMRDDPERYATRIEPTRRATCAEARLELLPEFSLAEAKLEAMDRKGIEISVISPGPQVFFYNLKEEEGIEAAGLVNDGIAAMVAKNPARLRGMATLPMQHPEAAVAEMERVAREYGFKGIELATAAPAGELADPRSAILAARAGAEDDHLRHPAPSGKRAPRLLLPLQTSSATRSRPPSWWRT